MKKVAIGSKNPAKIQAIVQAFAQVFPDESFEFIETSVASGVADQPLDDEETLRGAHTRAQSALEKKKAEFGVGVEGGLHKIGDQWFTGNVACVVTKAHSVGYGISPRVTVPPEIMEIVKMGKDLSEAAYEIKSVKDIGRKEGLLGMQTRGLITRASASEQAIIAALCSAVQS